MRATLAKLILITLTVPAFAGVFGKDDRVKLDPNGPEIGFAGFIGNNRGSCSVGLVGKRTAVSNCHCFFNKDAGGTYSPADFIQVDPDDPQHGWFKRNKGMLNPVVVVGLDSGTFNATFEFEEIYWGSCESEDIAVLKLGKKRVDHPEDPAHKFPGELFKTLEVCPIDLVGAKIVNFAGFSLDFTFFSPNKGFGHVEHSCTAEFVDSKIKHFCDMDQGASGGPLWVNALGRSCLVGVNFGRNCPNTPRFNSGAESCVHQAIENLGVSLSEKWKRVIEQFESSVD